ncbi:MAG: hypothetical protein KAI84_01235 [Gammaproteobacteria bacterium]|nr:hypothetical protein [Gammaproteobacteria bacterium]
MRNTITVATTIVKIATNPPPFAEFTYQNNNGWSMTIASSFPRMPKINTVPTTTGSPGSKDVKGYRD